MEEKIKIQFKTVFQSTNVIMAATVQEDLIRAGFKALLNDVGDGEFQVVVPVEDFENTKALLITKSEYGEHFAGPKEKE